MILIDTESTHLRGVSAMPIELQPWIVEFSGLKVDPKTLKVLDRLTFRSKPPIPLPKDFIRITGIKDEDIKNEKPFAANFLPLVDFFLGERTLVAHNEPYDRGVLVSELTRLDRLTSFPWPPERICTAEVSSMILGKNLKMRRLLDFVRKGEPKNYDWAEKDEIAQTHRADQDVDQLLELVIWLRKKKML